MPSAKLISPPAWRRRLREARVRAKLSQSDLARLIGRSQSSVASYELEAEPTLETWAKLAQALNTTPQWLIFGDTTPAEAPLALARRLVDKLAARERPKRGDCVS